MNLLWIAGAKALHRVADAPTAGPAKVSSR
jgi:hypothetical protein